MQNNYKLKRAVSLALGLLALGFQQQALSLGLGDIEIKSHLGQPLKAKIKVFGADELTPNELKEGGCFKLGNADNPNQITDAIFTLSNIVGNEATLSVISAEIIDEPIANLAVSATCGGNINRDYVLLIDPAFIADSDEHASIELNEAVETTLEDIKPVAGKKPDTAHHQLADTQNEAPVKKSRSSKKYNKNNQLISNNNANIILHVPGGSAVSPPASLENNANERKPLLTISGGIPARLPLGNVNLRLDRQLTFTPDASAKAPIEEIELQDEVTVMNNRMAHLQKQISSLQQRNLQLEADNKQKTQQLDQNLSFIDNFNGVGYALGGLLVLAGGYLSINWLRRRKQAFNEFSEASWATSDQSNSVIEDSTFDDEIDFFDTHVRQPADSSDEKLASMAHRFDDAQPIEESFMVEDNNQDLTILDHADVFLSHGRTALAIELLQNHLLDHPKQSVTIWLFLLDLLAKENMQAKYEQTALECKEHFNIKTADFLEGNSKKNSNDSLESFPHLSLGLTQTWGTPAAIIYLDDLIYNNRLEPRVGFEKSLMDELVLLKSLAELNLSSAEVIQLDEKKTVLKQQKDALLAAKKAGKLKELALKQQLEKEKTEILAKSEKNETDFEFKLVEWK
ncbi:MAG: type IV pilus assembly protein FimV [Methylophilaceae bacterium]